MAALFVVAEGVVDKARCLSALLFVFCLLCCCGSFGGRAVQERQMQVYFRWLSLLMLSFFLL